MVSRVLLATEGLTLGEFLCASGDRLWDEVNDIGSRAHVVFPRTRVLIAQDGAHPVLATPNHVVFYKPHQRYRRGLRDGRTYHLDRQINAQRLGQRRCADATGKHHHGSIGQQ